MFTEGGGVKTNDAPVPNESSATEVKATETPAETLLDQQDSPEPETNNPPKDLISEMKERVEALPYGRDRLFLEEQVRRLEQWTNIVNADLERVESGRTIDPYRTTPPMSVPGNSRARYLKAQGLLGGGPMSPRPPTSPRRAGISTGSSQGIVPSIAPKPPFGPTAAVRRRRP